VRRADAEIIPPLSDYIAFWERERPFLFLTAGRWRHYHTTTDTPEKLDHAKMEATARWLERFVRASAARDDGAVAFQGWAADDASTLRSLIEITGALAAVSPEAEQGRAYAEALLADCNQNGRLPGGRRREVQALVQMLEERLA